MTGYTYFETEESKKESKKLRDRRILSFIFMAVVLFLLWFSINNLETYIILHVTNIITINGLEAVLVAVILTLYTFFILEAVRPERFNLKISLISITMLAVFCAYTFFLLN
jgi:cation transport ATPase